ncbi:MAG: LysR family transcriptional regulator [Phenylobacterium sp.]|nr:LysR family transcriptional regulator [Phenylobacterium sp.]
MSQPDKGASLVARSCNAYPNRMDVRHARQILEIWRRKSLGGAARALKISQPTLSRSLARVEDQLGVTLFERGPNGATPTTYAEYIVSRIAPALERMDALAMEVQQMARGEAGRLRIGAAPLARVTILEDVCLEVSRRFPNLRVQVSLDPAEALAQKLVGRQLDIAFSSSEILTSEALRHDPEARAFSLFAYDTRFHAHHEHPIVALKRELTADDVLAYPIASLSISRTLRESFPISLTDAQNGHLRALQTGDYDLLRRVVSEGRAIGFGPAPLFERDVREGRIVSLRFGAVRERRGIALLMPEYLQSPLARQIIEIAIQAARRMEGTRDPG